MSIAPVRILLVEDNPGDARLVREALGSGNGSRFELTHVDRLASALDLLGHSRVDLVLLDLSLPDETGIETLLKTLKAAPGTPVVVLTGLADEERALEAIRRGAQDYLVKGQIQGPLLERSVRYSLERTETLQALRESEERFALAVRGANDGLWDWNLKTDRIFYSPRWKEMLGHSEDEVSDSPEEWFGRIHPEDATRARERIESHRSGRPGHFEDEHRMRHKSGVWRWMLVRGLAVLDDSGRALRMAGSLTDVTARKEMDRLKDEFLSTVSHELRTPLTSIHGSLQLVAAGTAGRIPGKARELVEIACKNSERLTRLINDLLDIQRIQAGKHDGAMAVDLKPLELSPLVRQAIDVNIPFAERLGVRLEMDGAAPSVRVRADALRLVQVMTNLLSNAAKFSPKGAVVKVAVSSSAGRVRVSVTDRGPGVPEEFRPRIFEKFAQADSSPSRCGSGTGLGLSIAKGIVEGFGGRIGFESEPHVATTFYFELPQL